MGSATELFLRILAGDAAAADDLLPLVYNELKILAASKIGQEKPGQTLSATALVHEAYIRLVSVDSPQNFNGRAHFFGAAAQAMRRILVERARYKKSLKRGGNLQRVELRDDQAEEDRIDDEVLLVHESLKRLADVDVEIVKLVELKYFASLPMDELAEVLGISERTARRRWAYAKAWLREEIDSKR